MERKGISPIIASVLLLAVSLTVAGILSGWAPQLTQTVTEDTGNSTLQTLNCNEAGIELRSAFYNATSNETTITVRNTGPKNLPDVTLAAYDSDNLLIGQANNLNYSTGTLNTTIMTGVEEEPSYLEAFSSSCSSVTDKLEDINR